MPTPIALSASPGYAHGFGSTIAETTASAVLSANKIVGLVAWWGGAGGDLSSISGGGLTWNIEVQNTGTSYRFAIISADAPAGMPSSTTVTATFSVTSEDRMIRLFQVDGLATGTADGTGSTATISTSAITINLTVGTTGDFVFAGLWEDNDTAPNVSWTAPATKIGSDWSNSAGSGSGGYSAAYKTGVASGAQTMVGTLAGTNKTGAAAAFQVAGGAAAARTPAKVYNRAAVLRASTR